jgi:hypothetical protein
VEGVYLVAKYASYSAMRSVPSSIADKARLAALERVAVAAQMLFVARFSAQDDPSYIPGVTKAADNLQAALEQLPASQE